MAFMGGSAYSMANSLMEGYLLPSPVNLKRLTIEELRELHFEVEKLLRDQRGIVPDQSDSLALQKRNMRIMKLSQAQSVIVNFTQLRAKGQA
jgi:PDZ domain-containing secreted protein